ncbi:MAG: hypothetical protein HAW59_04300, partial [Betaproteobacteria bacterium]|nr:hypothetical protein [Betaproteobacteria bacterium]
QKAARRRRYAFPRWSVGTRKKRAAANPARKFAAIRRPQFPPPAAIFRRPSLPPKNPMYIPAKAGIQTSGVSRFFTAVYGFAYASRFRGNDGGGREWRQKNKSKN